MQVKSDAEDQMFLEIDTSAIESDSSGNQSEETLEVALVVALAHGAIVECLDILEVIAVLECNRWIYLKNTR